MIVRAWQHLLQGLRLRQTCKKGFVRRFEGQLGWFDPTDESLLALDAVGLLNLEPGSVNSVELLANQDVAYCVNGEFQKYLLRLSVTSATRRPSKATLWNVSASWGEEGTPNQDKRRRPSPEELEELAEYGRLSRAFWLQSALRVVLFTPPVAYGITLVYIGLARKLAENVHLTYDPLQVSFRVLISAVLVALLIVGAQVSRRIRLRERIKQELELGWIIVNSTSISLHSDSLGVVSGPAVEYFPLTNLLWTIDGKPAGWRRHAKRTATSGPSN
ncbi:MAG: hypothetical protein K1Y02_02225 [Candidatus Hydrogenedentes bacterium]|nr:hypothetical protein [Candidatus Hydrogenedentota bacterium]